ncbi:MAG: MDR/zinc-dependent alcohol dehydrogenase-like family protein [Pyrinomonadaceae bacterium]
MNALVFTDRKLSVDSVPMPYADDEAIVRVTTSGICNTDLEIVRGYAGFEGIIGHEFVGVVEESAENPDLVGKRVVGEINVGCDVCDWCKKFDARHCPNRTVLGIHGRQGAHAEFLSLPAKNLFEVPEKVSNSEAVFTEPLAAAYGITEQVDISAETRVAVIGDGKLGILAAWSMALKSNRVTLIGKHKSKLAVAESDFIKTRLLTDVVDLDSSFDVVIEASGAESGFAIALDLVRPRGKIVLKSTFHGTPKWDAARVVVDEISIIGSRCGRFQAALNILESGTLDLKRLISERFSLANGVEAMSKAGTNGVMKVLLEMN